jgi:hypothetical protein
MTSRFSGPCQIAELSNGFAVYDAAGRPLGSFYSRADQAGHAHFLMSDDARQIAADFVKLPEMLKQNSGRSEVATSSEDDKLAKIETSCSPEGPPENRHLPRVAQLPAVAGLPLIEAPTSIPNAILFEPNGWMTTPLLRRPSDPFSSRMKFLIAIAVVLLPAGYFIFWNSDRPIDVAAAPQATTDISSVEFLWSPEAQAPAAVAAGTNVENRVEAEVLTALLQPTGPSDTKPTESGSEAKLPQTVPEAGEQLPAARGYGSTCYTSASAVRQNHPGGRPSWTMRVPGHEGTKCWYPATQTVAEAGAPLVTARSLAVESRAEPEVQPSLRSRPTESGTEARPPLPPPESGHDSTCYPSASDLRQSHPGAWPSWTLRAPGHEGTRCWYPRS